MEVTATLVTAMPDNNFGGFFLKNSPNFRCLTLPQYLILIHLNHAYGVGAFELALIDRYTISAVDEHGRHFFFRWNVQTKQITKEVAV